MKARGLLSFFEPFNGYASNSSQQVASTLLARDWSGVELSSIELPVDFNKAWPLLEQQIQKHQPDFVLSFGQAGKIAEVHLERVAINLMDARIPDNSGFQPEDQAILPDGPTAFFATLPLKALIQHLHRRDHKSVVISHSAGTYVCNSIMYRLLEYAHRNALAAGFIHIPLLPDQVKDGKAPEVHASLETSVQIVTEIIHYLAQQKVNAAKVASP